MYDVVIVVDPAGDGIAKPMFCTEKELAQSIRKANWSPDTTGSSPATSKANVVVSGAGITPMDPPTMSLPLSKMLLLVQNDRDMIRSQ